MSYLLGVIKKLSYLLQISFGEAGKGIMSKNLVDGVFNVMLPGRRVNAIICFCDIRGFTTATEALQGEAT